VWRYGKESYRAFILEAKAGGEVGVERWFCYDPLNQNGTCEICDSEVGLRGWLDRPTIALDSEGLGGCRDRQIGSAAGRPGGFAQACFR